MENVILLLHECNLQRDLQDQTSNNGRYPADDRNNVIINNLNQAPAH